MAIYHVRGGIGNQAALGREHDRHWPPIPFIAGLEPGHLGFRRVSFCNAFSSPGLPADIGAERRFKQPGQGTRPRIQRFYHVFSLPVQRTGPEKAFVSMAFEQRVISARGHLQEEFLRCSSRGLEQSFPSPLPAASHRAATNPRFPPAGLRT
jgi:hypothetical protein